MRLSELTEWYIGVQTDLREASRRCLRASTKAMIKHFKDVEADTIEHQQVVEWRKDRVDRNLERKSWNTYSNNMKTIYQLAMDEEILNLRRNPFRKTTVKLITKPKKTLSRVAIEQARLYLQQLEHEEKLTHKRAKATPAWFWRCVFEMYWSTGMRLSALLHIRPMDVNLPELKIVVRGEVEKTYRQYEVPITESLEPLIRRLCEAAKISGIGPRDQLFNVNRFSHHYEKEVMDPDQVEAFYKKLSAAVGVRMTPHRFRHTLATDLMKEADRNINVVQTILNHTSLTTTMGYIETDFEIMREVLTERESRARVGRRVARVDESGGRRVLEQARSLPAEALATPSNDAQPLHLLPNGRADHPTLALQPANERLTQRRSQACDSLHHASPDTPLQASGGAAGNTPPGGPDLATMQALMSALLNQLTQSGVYVPVTTHSTIRDTGPGEGVATLRLPPQPVRMRTSQSLRGS